MSTESTVVPAAPAVRAAVRATYVAFAGSGFAFASWAARIPQVRSHLHLSPAALGLLLLCIAAGSVIALPLAGPIVHRLGSGRTVAVTAAVLCTGLATVAVGYHVGVVPVAVGLFLMGFGNGAWDVAMNVQAALVERHLGRSIMARFHAGYSLGTVVGALLGAAMVALRVAVTTHLLVVAAVVVAVVVRGTAGFIADSAADERRPAGPPARNPLAAWTEPRTVAIGLFVLASAFAEGAGNDWISVAAIDGYHLPAAAGTLAFACFLAAMTVARWFGPAVLDRRGRVAVVRVLALTGIAGSLLFVLAPVVPLAYLGVLLWGVGVSLGFPVGMSAAADDPRHAAGRVSVVASIGYCAFLGGPPLVGFLGDQVTVLRALVSVSVLLAVAALVSGVVAPRTDAAPRVRAGRLRSRR